LKSFLVIQLARLGDLMQSIPLLRAIRAANPTSRIILATAIKPPPFVLQIISEYLLVEPADHFAKSKDSDLLLSMLRETLDTVKYFADCNTVDILINLNDEEISRSLSRLIPAKIKYGFTDSENTFSRWMHAVAGSKQNSKLNVSEMFCAAMPETQPIPATYNRRGSKRIVIHPGSGDPSRSLSPEFWASLIMELSECGKGFSSLLSGSEREFAFNEKILDMIPSDIDVCNIAGKTEIDALEELMKSTDLLIAQDTGVLHLAAQLNCPVLGMYHGSARINETGPFQSGANVIQIKADCFPCVEGRPVCENYECRTQITPADVSLVAKWMLSADPDSSTPEIACDHFVAVKNQSGIVWKLVNNPLFQENDIRSKQLALLYDHVEESMHHEMFSALYLSAERELSRQTHNRRCGQVFSIGVMGKYEQLLTTELLSGTPS
jgi:ADP-heptose:LPS heptosyltransferase